MASIVRAAPAEGPAPPVAERRPFDVVSSNGTRRDDYYWLRDDTRKSKDMLGYLEKENAYRDAYMAPSAALTRKLYDELIARLQPDDSSVPVFKRGYFYYTRFVPGRDYAVYARRKGAMTAPEEVLLDGNAMALGHSFFQIGDFEISRDGTFLAFTEDDVGRRQYTLRIKNLKTGETLADRVDNVSPDFVWAADSRTLVYVEKDPVTLLSVRVRKHSLGGSAPDPLVYEEKDHSYYMDVRESRSENFLFIDLRSTQQTEVRYADAADPKLDFRPVLPREADLEYHVDHLDKNFIIRTNWQAPNFRIVQVPIATSADKKTWSDVVPATDDTFIEDFEVSKKYLALNVWSGGLLKMRVKAWGSSGPDTVVASDEPTYAAWLVHTPGLDGSTVRYVFSSLATPRTTYDYDMGTGKKTLKKIEAVLGGFNAVNYRTEFLWVPARDGKKIPVSLVMRKDVRLDGTAPLYQYGYGSYGFSTEPVFRSNWVSLLDRGFVVAIAHVRGGQELGRAWFEDGRLLHKKNTFTDFIDVTERLVALRYAAKDKTFASGGSAGGLLVGAVSNMAPQDYRGIIAAVPFVDVVTTMLDESIPLTSNEFDQWGNPKEKKYYDYMLSYSPYDNVTAQRYPAMLVLTSLWDSQVQYYEPAKWVARLRATKTDHEALVLSVNMAGGHGGKSGRFERYHDTALEYAFIFRQLGITE